MYHPSPILFETAGLTSFFCYPPSPQSCYSKSWTRLDRWEKWMLMIDGRCGVASIGGISICVYLLVGRDRASNVHTFDTLWMCIILL